MSDWAPGEEIGTQSRNEIGRAFSPEAEALATGRLGFPAPPREPVGFGGAEVPRRDPARARDRRRRRVKAGARRECGWKEPFAFCPRVGISFFGTAAPNIVAADTPEGRRRTDERQTHTSPRVALDGHPFSPSRHPTPRLSPKG